MSVPPVRTIPKLSMLCALSIKKHEKKGILLLLPSERKFIENALPLEFKEICKNDFFDTFASNQGCSEDINFSNIDYTFNNSGTALKKEQKPNFSRLTPKEAVFLPKFFQIIFANELKKISEAIEKKAKHTIKKLLYLYLSYGQYYLFSELQKGLCTLPTELKNSIFDISTFHDIIKKKQPAFVKLFLEALDKDAVWPLLNTSQGSWKETALHRAASVGCSESCTLILEAAKSKAIDLLFRVNKFNHTPLFEAVNENNSDCCVLMLEAAGNRLNELVLAGGNILHFAICKENLETIQVLIRMIGPKIPDLFLSRVDRTQLFLSGRQLFVPLLFDHKIRELMKILGIHWYEALSSTGKNGNTFFAEYLKEYEQATFDTMRQEFDLPNTPQVMALLIDAHLACDKKELAEKAFQEATQTPQCEEFLVAAMQVPYLAIYLMENMPNEAKSILSTHVERIPIVVLLLLIRVLTTEQVEILLSRLNNLHPDIRSELLFSHNYLEQTPIHLLTSSPHQHFLPIFLNMAGKRARWLVICKDKFERSALSYAAMNATPETMQALISAVENDKVQFMHDCNGLSPIHHAAANGNADAIPVLIQEEENPLNVLHKPLDYTSNNKDTSSKPIHLAAMNGHIAFIEKLLVCAGDAVDEIFCNISRELTVLDYAILYKQLACAEYLLSLMHIKRKIQFLNHQNYVGNNTLQITILHWYNNQLITKLLEGVSIEDRCKILSMQNKEGKTAIDMFFDKFPEATAQDIKIAFGLDDSIYTQSCHFKLLSCKDRIDSK